MGGPSVSSVQKLLESEAADQTQWQFTGTQVGR